MDFTREPIIETVVTPREGYRLVVRSSKSAGGEEHFVDALEVVSFGNATFFRSTERPKPFIVPVSDYEVLEVREARMVLKTPVEGAIKLAASEKPQAKKVKEEEKREPQPPKEEGEAKQPTQPTAEARGDRRRDRRRGLRRRRGRGERDEQSTEQPQQEQVATEVAMQGDDASKILTTQPMLSTILPPPTTLIRDDLERLRKHEAFKGAFYTPEEADQESADVDFPTEAFGYSERDINMKEGGDAEVPQEDPFRFPHEEEGIVPENAAEHKTNHE